MEGKSPKRTREVVVGREAAGKRLKGEDGEAVANAESEETGLETPMQHYIPLTNITPLSDNIPTVRKAFAHLSDSKMKLTTPSLHPASLAASVHSALSTTPSFTPVNTTTINEQYSEARKRQKVLEETAEAYEARLRALEESLKATQNDSQARVMEKKMIVDELEARKNAVLDQRKRENERLKSMLENYRRLTGIEMTPLETGEQRCRLRLHHNEIIFKVHETTENELEVQVLSYTVPAEKIPTELKEEIVIEVRDAPKLLHLLLSCLL